ncbi:hypothetical protein FJTKL_02434 [Diaporthe vaccinii]|uniref:Uncharacterized protein n=1 Tax=Diaporthe vaccinii TaxID=105482 RepID=A0ABR4DYF5_9PEZI
MQNQGEARERFPRRSRDTLRTHGSGSTEVKKTNQLPQLSSLLTDCVRFDNLRPALFSGFLWRLSGVLQHVRTWYYCMCMDAH